MHGEGLPTRTLPDWIEAFCDYTGHLPSPLIFRKWAAISAIAGALERRVWVRSSGGVLYPNLYVLLVAPPAVGKSQAISPVKDFWQLTKQLRVAPDDLSKASLLDSLEQAKQLRVMSAVDMLEYHSMQIAASEFGVLVPSHDLAFLNTLNHIFDNPDAYSERKRTTKKEMNLVEPSINLLAGTQPAYLAELLPETAWGMGFTSRIIFVYSGQKIQNDLFSFHEHKPHAKSNLVEDMKAMCELYGEMRWTPEAMEHLRGWHMEGMTPVPQHSRLEHYNGRRILHVLKLCAISCASRGNHLLIDKKDVERAIDWLLEAERFMPDIFRAMIGNSDIAVLEELHMVACKLHSATGKPVGRSRIVAFLQTRLPAERIPRVIESAVGSGLLKSADEGVDPPVAFIPGAKPSRIME